MTNKPIEAKKDEFNSDVSGAGFADGAVNAVERKIQARIALAGNPNTGKTTLFNALTGSNQYVGNWSGVTVEKKEGRLKNHADVTIIDLPGIYSLSPYTLEEVISRNYLLDERPDAIINIIDGTNLERNLFLTTQLIELGIPVVIAINMIDAVKKAGDKINVENLAKSLGCAVVEISALKNIGTTEIADAAVSAANLGEVTPYHSFSGGVEHTLGHIEEAVLHHVPDERQRFFAIKLFERDKKIIEKLDLTQEQIAHIEDDIKRREKTLDDDSESIIITERYTYIDSVVKECLKLKNKYRLTTTDKIDAIVTNRFFALPIFAAVMFLVYFVSVSTVGAFLTEFVNEEFFGRIVPASAERFLTYINCADWLTALIVDGVIAGVGAVLGFVPQLMILFIFLAFLEGCGYMARIAFILDRVFRKFGLSGKSFIPILIGTGCGVPGIMAARTIEHCRDRRMTVITTTFIPCSAKLPMIALFAGALFGGAWWVAPSAYFIGIAAIVCSGIILKKTKWFKGDVSPFILELPPYHLPSPGRILRSMWERSWSFVKKAGTVVLLASIILWFALNYGWQDGSFGQVSHQNSIMAIFGNLIAWLFIPLGWGDGQAAVATITGLIAKENIVGAFGIFYSNATAGAATGTENVELWQGLSSEFTKLSAFSFLIFNLLCAPCFAALGAIRREMNSPKWFWFAVIYQCSFAYVVSLCVYQFGMAFTGVFGAGTVAAGILAALFLYLLLRKPKRIIEGRIR